ncbi:MAG: dnaE [Dehalococcoidia bacterium]|nr:dnaE [Dehalococcoidia bacterium]
MKSLNRRALESMIKVGALDRLGSRGALLASVERILAAAQREQKLKESGQATMFDLWGESVPVPMPAFELPDGDVPAKEKLTWEKELLGVYLSQHPFAAVAQRAVQGTTALCGQVNEELVGQTVIVAGMVSSARQLVTKSQRSFMSAVLEDLVGSLEVTVWPEVYEKTREIWTAGQIVLVRGKVTVRDGNVQLVCDSAQAYQEVEETDQEYPSDEVTSAPGARYAEAQSRQLTSQERTDISSNYKTAVNALVISIQETDDMGSDLARLREVESALSRHPGVAPVVLEVTDRDGVTHRLAFENMAVRCESTLIQELSVLVGSDNLRLVDTNGHELTKDLKASKAGIG